MSAKVVDHPSRDAPPSAALLTRCRDIIVGRAAGFLEELLLVLDDELFALAESARSDRTQQQFFDAMRTMRLAREQICARFRACLQAPAPAPMEDAESGSDENTPLSLLENDALEQRIAVTTMSQRVERAHELQLTLLRVRVRHLETQCGTHDVVVPIEPHHFAHGFATAVRPLELESDIRLILFKRFEQGALARLGKLFDDLNGMLAEAGVLPDLTAAQAVSPRQPGGRPISRSTAPSHGTAQEDNTPATGGSDAALSHAFEGYDRRQLAEGLAALPGLRSRRRYGSAAGATALVSRLLMDIATAAQGRIGPRLDASLDVVPRRIDYGELLTHSALRRGQSIALEGADEDVVNLVQALFDQLLADDNLPVPMRALLARLQFPVLRIALSDSSFIASATHPARRFLNLITCLGIGWVRADERAQDRLYQVIERCVGAFARSDALDAKTIESFNETIERALKAEADSVEHASRRVIEQERARLEDEKTRRFVERLVAHRCSNARTEALRQFLMRDWQQVMFKAHQLEGTRSAAWKLGFRVLRSLTGERDLDNQALRSALREGLLLLGRSEEDAAEGATRALTLLLEGADGSNGEQAAPSPAPNPSEQSIEALPDRTAMGQANRLEVGEWIELHRDAGASVRCRLATVTDPPERCIFLNRRGVRIETLSRLELAAAIQDGRVRSIDSDQIFDNTLASVIGGLRNATPAPSV